MNQIKTRIGRTPEFTHGILRNSSLELEDRDRLPSKVVQDIDLARSLSSKLSGTMIPSYLIIPPTDSYISTSGVPGNTADAEPGVLRWTEGTL